MADVDNDGDLDLFVANDGSDSELRLNRRTGAFVQDVETAVDDGKAPSQVLAVADELHRRRDRAAADEHVAEPQLGCHHAQLRHCLPQTIFPFNMSRWMCWEKRKSGLQW